MLEKFLNLIKTGNNKIEINGCHGAAKAYVAAKTFQESNCSIAVIFLTHKDATRFMDDLLFFMPEMQSSIIYFSGYSLEPFKPLSYHAKTSASRVSVLYKLIEHSCHYFVITSVDTLIYKTLPKNILSKSVDIVINGETLDRDLLISRLNANGYLRRSLVEEPGDYAVRGEIVDIFSPNYENPIRIDLFGESVLSGDRVDSLRYFSPITQRGIDEIEEAIIIPPNEMILEKSTFPNILSRLRQAGTDLGLSSVKIKEYIDQMKELGKFPGLESLLPIVYGELDSILSYLPENTLFFMDKPEELEFKATLLYNEAIKNYENAKLEQRLCVDTASVYMKWHDVLAHIEQKTRVAFKDFILDISPCELSISPPDSSGLSISPPDSSGLSISPPDSSGLSTSPPDSSGLSTSPPDSSGLSTLPPDSSGLSTSSPDSSKKELYSRVSFNLHFKDNLSLSAKLRREGVSEHDDHILQPLADWFIANSESNLISLVVCTSSAQAGRIISLLKPYGIDLQMLDHLSLNRDSKSGSHYYMIGNLSSGFVHYESHIAIITDQEIFGVKKRIINRSTKRAKSRFITPEELKEGDIVVHLEHGLGRYEGLKTITLDGISGDFIQIAYKDDDRLYLPVDRMEMVEKYLGVEGYIPMLDKIGGKTWINARAKAKKEVEKMAGELLKLYAERRVAKGHAFSPSDSYYDEFQASFPYDETPDQLKAIEDVLADMEDETPMDRLVCGDVGYGKTEVAIRASFKAVNDGKQVAVVVPTTILAEQHLHTFRERFKGWAITVEALSRFRTTKEQKQILSGLDSGKIDVVIGTHRLLQKDVLFKSLGLLVIDEEQRFGVKHKEALKSKRTTVDVLALTATPIPRTLHMSLTGMRDISIISTPPEDRQAIVSYILEYNDAVVIDAIRKELGRGGQIFFIHNQIETIFKMAEKLKQLVPQVRLGIAHGKLPEATLEKVMVQFIKREIDMLVCTTIVESGLDIPSANTMIINKADRFGLAQIYQLRGRIGRSDEQAYAYMFVPDESKLSRDAQKRLSALMEHRDLGSGFQIAMKDLQIRGSGSALGASQSGHIASVGYDMFLKLLDEAICDLKGKPVVPALEPEINVAMSAHIPEAYVQSIEQRLTIYRRLSQMTEISEITTMQKELIDRFGRLPEEGLNMLLKIMLRILAIKAGVKRMDVTLNSIGLVFSELHQKRSLWGLSSDTDNVFSINGFEYQYTAENAVKINLGSKNKKISRALVETKKILKEIAVIVGV